MSCLCQSNKKDLIDQEHPFRMCTASKKALFGLNKLTCVAYDKLSAFLIKSGFTKAVVDSYTHSRGKTRQSSSTGLPSFSKSQMASLSNLNPNMLREILKKFGFDSCTPIDTPYGGSVPTLMKIRDGKLIDPNRFSWYAWLL
ncbi:hypothetical protein Tco_0551141 [Tanacetum coccineum]